MNNVICLPSSDTFLKGTGVLLFSLLKNLKNVDECDVKIYYNTLSDKSKDVLSKIHPKVIFCKPQDTSYCKNAQTIYGRGNQDCYLSFEAFNQPDYDTSIYMDADMLCIKDFSEIFDMTCSFMAYFKRKPYDKNNSTLKYAMRMGLQNAFMVIRKPHTTAYRKLCSIVKTITKDNKFCDQFSQSIYLKGQKIRQLPIIYNFHEWGGNPHGKDEFSKYRDDVKIIHYSGRRKPWGPAWSGSPTDHCCIRFKEDMERSEAVQLWHNYMQECKVFND